MNPSVYTQHYGISFLSALLLVISLIHTSSQGLTSWSSGYKTGPLVSPPGLINSNTVFPLGPRKDSVCVCVCVCVCRERGKQQCEFFSCSQYHSFSGHRKHTDSQSHGFLPSCTAIILLLLLPKNSLEARVKENNKNSRRFFPFFPAFKLPSFLLFRAECLASFGTLSASSKEFWVTYWLNIGWEPGARNGTVCFKFSFHFPIDIVLNILQSPDIIISYPGFWEAFCGNDREKCSYSILSGTRNFDCTC